MPEKPPTRRPRGGTVKDLVNQPPAETPLPPAAPASGGVAAAGVQRQAAKDRSANTPTTNTQTTSPRLTAVRPGGQYLEPPPFTLIER